MRRRRALPPRRRQRNRIFFVLPLLFVVVVRQVSAAYLYYIYTPLLRRRPYNARLRFTSKNIFPSSPRPPQSSRLPSYVSVFLPTYPSTAPRSAGILNVRFQAESKPTLKTLFAMLIFNFPSVCGSFVLDTNIIVKQTRLCDVIRKNSSTEAVVTVFGGFGHHFSRYSLVVFTPHRCISKIIPT